MKDLVYYFIHFFLRVFFITIFRVKVKGLENISKNGSFILASSHFSNFDPPLVGCFVSRVDLHFFAKEELFRNKLIGAFLKFSRAFPVKRGRTDTKAMAVVFDLLKDGHGLLMFPEGTRRKEGKEPIAKRGLGYIVSKTHTPVIPVKIINSHKIFKLKTSVIFGEPMIFDENLEDLEISQKVLDRIESL